MKKLIFSILLILSIISKINCVPRLKRYNHIIQKINRTTGEVTAVDHLIRKYEREHQRLYAEKIGDGDYLEWPALDDKGLSKICKQFLQHSLPGRNSDDANGFKHRRLLKYKKENTELASPIVIVHCKIKRNNTLSYYITRAPEPNCVYSMNCTHKGAGSVLTIINKYCDIEKKSVKLKESEIICNVRNSSGQLIAKDEFLLKYELEHQELVRSEENNGKLLKWPALDDKDLSNYCKTFLQYTVPRRKTNNVNGAIGKRVLKYKKVNTNSISTIVIVHCKIINKNITSYYITRAPEPICVYVMNGIHKGPKSVLTIINKHCGFEEMSLKLKRDEIVSTTHQSTGQPIAKEKYLEQYELDHQELLRSMGENGNRIPWPRVMLHENLDSYCDQYLSECVPSRKREDITGKWRIEKLHYQYVTSNQDIYIIVVVCRLPNATKCNYYITRAVEKNCVYALLRSGYKTSSPLVIGFKHCDFEERNNEPLTSHSSDIFGKGKIRNTEVKEETFDKLKLIPKDKADVPKLES